MYQTLFKVTQMRVDLSNVTEDGWYREVSAGCGLLSVVGGKGWWWISYGVTPNNTHERWLLSAARGSEVYRCTKLEEKLRQWPILV